MSEQATLAGGCFWCLDAAYRRVRGIEQSICGYSGGNADNPSYREVHAAASGHAEVVQLTFDPAVISFETILDIFWAIHDPTTLNRQGHDVGSEYRSAIFYHNQVQRKIAEQSLQRAQKLWKDPIVTLI